ncbi:MAG: methyltransferase domain-containing protein [Bacteroidetes bacterium]|nr:methyltransferase domain-containing protein [Bacteroidota bacterium]MBL7058772.1 methyltransferase domain-containing protein [Patescibacteria group bacterium]
MILENIKIDNKVDNSPEEIIKNISKLEWKDGLYGKQSWGHSLHKIAPYVGRIKPPFAHFLIKYVTKPGDTILDPFCGIGTIPLEGSLCGRNTIGVDLNPYAITISEAKTQHNLILEDLIDYVENLDIISKGVSIRKIPDWVKEYYNKNTLKEILYTLNILKADEQKFIYGCLVGISQGHRPGHLSKPCAWTLPYKPRPDDPGEYRDVKTRLIAKIKRNYKDKIESSGSIKILKEDSRKLSLENESVDHIISSPPYYNTLDYVNSHRLRLAICGVYKEDDKKALRDQTIQRYKDYLDEMRKVIVELYRVLKPGGYCVFVVGDHFKGKLVINTSEELAVLFKEVGFTYYGAVEDPIPVNKSVQKTTKKVKFERIMLLQK